MFLLHVNLKSLLVLVVPVTLGALESLAGVVRSVPAEPSQSVGVHDQVTLGTVQAGRSAVDVFRAGPDGGALARVGTC